LTIVTGTSRPRRRRRPGATLRGLVEHADAREVGGGYALVKAAAPRLVAAGNRFDGLVPADAGPQVAADAPAFFAAASILHLEDGYSYAGRSIGALLRGDRGCASHMAYYAELRAALSLLAANGVLTLNTVVFALASSGELRRETPGLGTHRLAWRLLDHWTRRTAAFDLLGDALRPFNVPLRDWLQAAAVVELAAPAQATAQHWLRAWSLDLQRMDADQEARNRFSYNPTRLYPRPAFAAQPFVIRTWRLLEPTPGNPFEAFDRHLLRAIVDFMMANTVAQAAAQDAEHADGDAPTGLARTRVQALDRYLASARAGVGAGPWEAFLRRAGPQAEDAPLVAFAALRDDNPWCLLSRALVLLRVAAGAVRNGMRAAGALGAPELAEWARALSGERGLVDIAVDDPHDLWDDIEVALDHLAGCPAPSGQTQSMLRRLETSERVALWALAA
jgi:hypothetical protein